MTAIFPPNKIASTSFSRAGCCRSLSWNHTYDVVAHFVADENAVSRVRKKSTLWQGRAGFCSTATFDLLAVDLDTPTGRHLRPHLPSMRPLAIYQQSRPNHLDGPSTLANEAVEVLRGGHAKRRTLPMPPFSASACAFAASASGIMRSTGILNFPFAISSASASMLAASGWELKASTFTAG